MGRINAQEADGGVVKQLKEAHPERSLHAITVVDGEDEYHFVMTGPTGEEWKKYRQEVTKAGDDIEGVEKAITLAALAQIRWPSRDVVKEQFDSRPGMPQHFAAELAKAAGATVEVRSKKL